MWFGSDHPFPQVRHSAPSFQLREVLSTSTSTMPSSKCWQVVTMNTQWWSSGTLEQLEARKRSKPLTAPCRSPIQPTRLPAVRTRIPVRWGDLWFDGVVTACKKGLLDANGRDATVSHILYDAAHGYRPSLPTLARVAGRGLVPNITINVLSPSQHPNPCPPWGPSKSSLTIPCIASQRSYTTATARATLGCCLHTRKP